MPNACLQVAVGRWFAHTITPSSTARQVHPACVRHVKRALAGLLPDANLLIEAMDGWCNPSTGSCWITDPLTCCTQPYSMHSLGGALAQCLQWAPIFTVSFPRLL